MLKKKREQTTELFRCPIEGKEFSTFAELQSHYMPRHARGLKTTSVEKLICPYDDLKFDNLESLQKHVKEKHPSSLGVIEPAFETEETFIKDIGINNAIEPSAVDVKNGRILRIRPLHFDETGYTKEELTQSNWRFEIDGKTFEPPLKTMPPYLTHGYKKRVYSPNRVKYPLKRVDWNPDGERNPQNRGPTGGHDLTHEGVIRAVAWDARSGVIRRLNSPEQKLASLFIQEE